MRCAVWGVGIWLLGAMPFVQAGFFPNPDFKEEPLVSTTFWSVAVPMLTSVGLSEESGGVDSTTEGTEGSSECSHSDAKLLLDARADAAAFVASSGAIRGARLEAALRLLREQTQWHGQTEQQLVLSLLLQGN